MLGTPKDPLLSTQEMKDGIGGTPKPPRKITAGRRGNSSSRIIDKEMILPPSNTAKPGGNTILHQKSAMGHKASTSVSGTKSTKDFATTLKQTGGPNGPVAPIQPKNEKQINSSATRKSSKTSANDSVSSEDLDIDNLGFSKQFGSIMQQANLFDPLKVIEKIKAKETKRAEEKAKE